MTRFGPILRARVPLFSAKMGVKIWKNTSNFCIHPISRALGPELGASIGLMFFLANAAACAMYIFGICETLLADFGENGQLLPNGTDNYMPGGQWVEYGYGSGVLFLVLDFEVYKFFWYFKKFFEFSAGFRFLKWSWKNFQTFHFFLIFHFLKIFWEPILILRSDQFASLVLTSMPKRLLQFSCAWVRRFCVRSLTSSWRREIAPSRWLTPLRTWPVGCTRVSTKPLLPPICIVSISLRDIEALTKIGQKITTPNPPHSMSTTICVELRWIECGKLPLKRP